MCGRARRPSGAAYPAAQPPLVADGDPASAAIASRNASTEATIPKTPPIAETHRPSSTDEPAATWSERRTPQTHASVSTTAQTVIKAPIGEWTVAPSKSGHMIEIRWPYAFIADYQQGLRVLDIRMPGPDGIETMGRMLSRDNRLPVILNTAYSSYKESFLSWSADAYVVKSSDLTELKAKIREVFAARAAARESPEAR